MRCCASLIATVSILAAALHGVGQEPALQPQQGVLVLKNRQVLEGAITPAGDYYLVTLGKTGQLRLARKDVEMVCRNLNEAYHRKAAAITTKSADAHLELAEWCLRQKMIQQAIEELGQATAIEPNHPKIAELERRVEFATTKPTTPVSAVKASVSTVGAQQLERTMKELPADSVEHFTAVVQPILMDRCGAAKCHGREATTSFELLQPSQGKIPSRRFTQRNLFATLTAVNKEASEQSQLLIMSLKPHGHTGTAAFENEKDRQYQELVEWVESLRARPAPAPPATVNTAQTGTPRHQVGDFQPAANVPTESVTESALPMVDPFDPSPFNSKYHPAR